MNPFLSLTNTHFWQYDKSNGAKLCRWVILFYKSNCFIWSKMANSYNSSYWDGKINKYLNWNFDQGKFVSDPSRHDSRASESWQTLLHRMRLLLLQAYNKSLGRWDDFQSLSKPTKNIKATFYKYFYYHCKNTDFGIFFVIFIT